MLLFAWLMGGKEWIVSRHGRQMQRWSGLRDLARNLWRPHTASKRVLRPALHTTSPIPRRESRAQVAGWPHLHRLQLQRRSLARDCQMEGQKTLAAVVTNDF